MNKHLKLFANHTAYEAAKNNIDKPNVVMCQQEDEVHFNSTPQPIAPVGKVQVFANPQCTEYANGNENTVYVRFNCEFGIDDSTDFGDFNNPSSHLHISCASTEVPDDPYGVMLWTNWIDIGQYSPYFEGQVLELQKLDDFVVQNPTVVFE